MELFSGLTCSKLVAAAVGETHSKSTLIQGTETQSQNLFIAGVTRICSLGSVCSGFWCLLVSSHGLKHHCSQGLVLAGSGALVIFIYGLLNRISSRPCNGFPSQCAAAANSFLYYGSFHPWTGQQGSWIKQRVWAGP